MENRAKLGDVVRLYGFPSTYRVERNARLPIFYDFWATPVGQEPINGWPALDSSVVEINGAPVALRSRPIAPPAPDYPHALILEEPATRI